MASNEPIGYRIVKKRLGEAATSSINVPPNRLFDFLRTFGTEESSPATVVAPYYEVDEGPTHYTPEFPCMPVQTDPHSGATLYVRSDLACCCVQDSEGEFWAEDGDVVPMAILGVKTSRRPDLL